MSRPIYNRPHIITSVLSFFSGLALLPSSARVETGREVFTQADDPFFSIGRIEINEIKTPFR